jgi:hypothetical protein
MLGRMKRYFYLFLSLLLLVMITEIAGADFTEGLVNRWTFNDQKELLVDDVGGVTLLNGGGVTFSDGQAIFDGGGESFLYSQDPRVNSERFGDTKEFTVWVKFEVDSYRDDIARLVRRNETGINSRTTFGLTVSGDSVTSAVISGSSSTGTPAGVKFSDKKPNVVAISFSSALLRNYGNGVERIRELDNLTINDKGSFTVGGLFNYNSNTFSQVFIGRIDEILLSDLLLIVLY